ncbi:MAG: ATP-dependent DNA helicase RecG, partial [Beijerinckiaceae bacterium]|nr:ATP-dependent DNA helicase RecG [Beijerinckiaceae bacterium]
FSLAKYKLQIGAERIVSGRLELYDGYRQLSGKIIVLYPDRADDLPSIEPVYAQTEGLTNWLIGKSARAALSILPKLPEWQDAAWLLRQGWSDFTAALQRLHRPREASDLSEGNPYLSRLAFDELLAGQLALLMVRSRMKAAAGRATIGDGSITARLRAGLPFALTGAQERAIAQIEADMAAPERMLRLLQGDVGSGKTLVGLMAMARAAEAGRQSVMMAPTEILARQHFERIAPLAEACGMTCALLTGRLRQSERRPVLEGLAAGSISICFGTHALFQDDVAFHDLALAVVDEQHKFGVHQRLALQRKGQAVDLLVMTATPIPRTLVLTYFGDMDVSIIDEKPPGRKPIDTRALPLDRLDEVIAGLGRAMSEGARVYWVCPLVSESEHLEDVAAAEQRFATLAEAFPGKVGMVHGKMPGPEKDAAVASFASGDTSVLVATTVIEVGVDVPEATVMVIEHAERFGLAQLHQLRGRVGRGGDRSSCLLLYRAPLGEVATARLKVMRETEDGFRIAEEDLKLRGEGDVLGTRQSGSPGFRLANPTVHAALLAAARDDAKLIIERDPQLVTERGKALRVLLYLFEQDEAVRLLRAG